MTTPKQPQDHRPKQKRRGKSPGPSKPFTFTHDGEEHTLRPLEEIEIGWYEDHEADSQMRMAFQLMRELSEEDTYKSIRSMKAPEFRDFQADFDWHNGVSQGE